MEELLVRKTTRGLYGGKQVIYRFKNGYGASVVNHEFSYGTELAVIKFDDDTDSFRLVYDTPITDDVIGGLDDDEIKEILERIALL